MTRYINPFIDYGFKKLFATEANKDLLISFLNAIINDTADPIMDLVYKNVEQIGEFNGIRASYFDIYCETHNGRKFIVEMQNSWKPFFKDRTVFYATKPIRDQGLKEIAESHAGKRKKHRKEDEKPSWDFRLNEVYLIAIMNFNFPKKEYKPDSFFHQIMLSDIDDNHVFYDKLTLIYVEMPKLDNIELDLSVPRNKWLYALYHLWRYDVYPDELDEDIFHKFYEQAEYARFTPNQQLTYERSQKFYLDTINEIEGGRIMGREEGRELGREEGRELGREEGRELGREEGFQRAKTEVARKMKAKGFDMETIVQVTGLSEEEFLNL